MSARRPRARRADEVAGAADAQRLGARAIGTLREIGPRNYPAFWIVLTLMAISAWIALHPGLTWFNEKFHVASEYESEAGPSLVVVAFAVICASIAGLNALLVPIKPEWEIEIDIPDVLRPWLPTIAAVAAGWLIGTTIFT